MFSWSIMTCLQRLWTQRVNHPLIFAKEEVGSFCGIQIPVRETTETTTCCEIPLPPSPLMPQTNPPHIPRTSVLAYIPYVCMCSIVCVIIRAHAHLFFCVWPRMPPGWSQRLGYVAYCISSWGGSWGCCAEALRRRAWFTVRRGPDVTGSVFWKTSSGPEGDNNLPNPVWLRSLPPKCPNPYH